MISHLMRVLKWPPGRLDLYEHNARVGRARTLGEHTNEFQYGHALSSAVWCVFWVCVLGNGVCFLLVCPCRGQNTHAHTLILALPRQWVLWLFSVAR